MYRAPRKKRYLERVLWLLAGTFVLVGTIAGYTVSFWRYLLPVLVGVNLIIFSLTGWCLMAGLLVKLGVKPLCDTQTQGEGK